MMVCSLDPRPSPPHPGHTRNHCKNTSASARRHLDMYSDNERALVDDPWWWVTQGVEIDDGGECRIALEHAKSRSVERRRSRHGTWAGPVNCKLQSCGERNEHAYVYGESGESTIATGSQSAHSASTPGCLRAALPGLRPHAGGLILALGTSRHTRSSSPHT